MRKAPLVALLMLAAAWGGASPADAPSLVGKDAPDFVLKALDGTNLRLSEYRGQVVLVNFWARWAGESREEMPVLNKINNTYGRAGLVVLGVSVDEDLQRAQRVRGCDEGVLSDHVRHRRATSDTIICWRRCP